MSLELTAMSVASLAVSVVVAISQVLLWRRDGVVIRCHASVAGEHLTITARNLGRGDGTITGYGIEVREMELP